MVGVPLAIAALGLANHAGPVVLLEADDSVCFGNRDACNVRQVRCHEPKNPFQTRRG